MMKIRLLIILLLAAVLPSCSLIEDSYPPCADEEDDGKTVMLSFQLDATGSLAGSRADDDGHAEVGSEYVDFEDGIDFNDLGIFVFAKEAGTSDDTPEKLVFKTTNVLTDTLLRIDGVPGAYYVDMKILKSQLESAINPVFTTDGKRNISIRVLIVANSAAGVNDWTDVTGSTFTDVIANLNEWSVPMSYVYEDADGEGVMDLYKNNIPMFGTNSFMVTQDELYNSREDRKVYLGEIDLLRSLAKVRVVDNIHGKDDDGYPKIVDVEFVGSQSQALTLPDGAPTYANGTQVHDPRVATENKNFLEDGAFRLGVIPEGWVESDIKAPAGVTDIEERSVRIGFVPEQAIYTISHSDTPSEIIGCPMFRIKIAKFEGDDGNYVLMDNKDVAMSRFLGFGQNILRNHIYTLYIDLTQEQISAEVRVAPYIGVDLEPVFGSDQIIKPPKPREEPKPEPEPEPEQ